MSIDFKLQDTIFNKLVKRNDFNKWKRPWEVSVRDFKPLWLYEFAQRASHLAIADKSKIVFRRSHVAPSLARKQRPKVHIGVQPKSEPVLDETYNLRKGAVKDNLFLELKKDFQNGVDRTGTRPVDSE